MKNFTDKYKVVKKTNSILRKENLPFKDNLENSLELNESKIANNLISHNYLECPLCREMNKIKTNKLELIKSKTKTLVCKVESHFHKLFNEQKKFEIRCTIIVFENKLLRWKVFYLEKTVKNFTLGSKGFKHSSI